MTLDTDVNAPTGETAQAPPAWFTAALSREPTVGTVEVLGATVSYRHWAREPESREDGQHRNGLVLVHGGAAHARWWDHLAPLFARHRDVVALDLTGHGESGHRDDYTGREWVAEVLAVSSAVGFDRPWVVGHSMGGYITIATAVEHSDRLSGAIVVDTPLKRPDPERDRQIGGHFFKNPKHYDTADEALDRFVLVPPQPITDDHAFIIDHVASHSIKQTESGWTWKFDPHMFSALANQSFDGVFERLQMPITYCHGEHSRIVGGDVVDYVVEVMGDRVAVVEIPNAHHHLILDQPLAFASAVNAAIAVSERGEGVA